MVITSLLWSEGSPHFVLRLFLNNLSSPSHLSTTATQPSPCGKQPCRPPSQSKLTLSPSLTYSHIAKSLRMYSSPQFTFLLGEAREPVFIYAKVIAALSEPINRVIIGSTREAQEQRAEVLDVEKKD